jgi:hypothetical protein
MSGPIVRKYGYPNFEKIFGERDLKHGVDDSEETAAEPASKQKKAPAKEGAKAASKAKTKK